MTVIQQLHGCFHHVSHLKWRKVKITVILHRNWFEINMTSRKESLKKNENDRHFTSLVFSSFRTLNIL